MRALIIVVSALLASLAPSTVTAQQNAGPSAYFAVPIGELVDNDTARRLTEWLGFQFRYRPDAVRIVVMNGQGYLGLRSDWPEATWPRNSTEHALYLRTTPGQDVTGRLFVPQEEAEAHKIIPFTVKADRADDGAKAAYERASRAHYRLLHAFGFPGAAWFRHQMNRSGATGDEDSETMRWRVQDQLEPTLDMFTGNRALAENLALHRHVEVGTNEPDKARPDVEVATIPGITIAAIDWKARIKDQHPVVDTLALLIPEDQHAIFFPSLPAMFELMDEVDADGTPILQVFEARSEDAGTGERYARQLGLERSGLSRLVGPTVVRSVAITGGDLSLRLGSDMAILFEPRDADALHALLQAKIEGATRAFAEAKTFKDTVQGISYSGATTDDRRLSSYLARIGDTLVVTNSKAQLERLVAVHQGATSLAALEEFLWFRSRYVVGDQDETAFLFLSDATIRRWCGPLWRITDSRRLRAAAELAEQHAIHALELGNGTAEARTLSIGNTLVDLGTTTLTPSGVRSSIYGGLEFMTPVLELAPKTVTAAEASAYDAWRTGYETQWRVFDPIGVHFVRKQGLLSADMTVLPLTIATEYRTWIDVARNARLKVSGLDLHDAVLHFGIALDPQSKVVQDFSRLTNDMTDLSSNLLLGWIGSSFSIYADSSPFWKELEETGRDSRFIEKNLHRLPIALRIESKSSLKLAAFVAAMQAYALKSAPGLVRFENRTHNEMAYIAVRGEDSGREVDPPLTVFYAATPRALVLTLDEDLLKRSLDREVAARSDTQSDGGAALAGDSVLLHLSPSMVDRVAKFGWLNGFGGGSISDQIQQLSFGNLPILNEWRRIHPGEDPIDVHQRLFGVRLLCPGGGSYQWNADMHTMESTVFGSPSAPKDGPGWSEIFNKIKAMEFGLTFEDDGLRARGLLRK